MKKKTMWGALALSAALAMGSAVPAFALTAADATVNDGDPANKFVLDAENKTNAGSTDVKVLADVTQIDAVLPLEVTVVADIQGGALKYTPTGDLGVKANGSESATGYRIENNTVIPIKVTSVKATENTAANEWAYSDSVLAQGDAYQLSGATNTLGRINLNVNTVNVTKDTPVSLDADNWTIKAATKSGETVTPGLFGLQLNGTTSYINSDEEISTADSTAVKLTYTIAIANVA